MVFHSIPEVIQALKKGKMVILLDDVRPEELPNYLHTKKHILWEQERPQSPEALHPAYGRIIRQLFKDSGSLSPSEVRDDATRLLDSFLNLLYAYGAQREVVARLGADSPYGFGELRRDMSFAAIQSWAKYSAIGDDPLVGAMRDLVAAVIHADIAVKDWALGYSETDFQDRLITDFRSTLNKVASLVGVEEEVGSIEKRLDLQRSEEMASLYRLEKLQKKSTLLWSTDVLGQLFRFGEYDPAQHNVEDVTGKLGLTIAEFLRNPYTAWRAANWPYPTS